MGVCDADTVIVFNFMKLVWTLLRALALEHGEIPKMLFIFKSKSDHVTVQQ